MGNKNIKAKIVATEMPKILSDFKTIFFICTYAFFQIAKLKIKRPFTSAKGLLGNLF